MFVVSELDPLNWIWYKKIIKSVNNYGFSWWNLDLNWWAVLQTSSVYCSNIEMLPCYLYVIIVYCEFKFSYRGRALSLFVTLSHSRTWVWDKTLCPSKTTKGHQSLGTGNCATLPGPLKRERNWREGSGAFHWSWEPESSKKQRSGCRFQQKAQSHLKERKAVLHLR